MTVSKDAYLEALGRVIFRRSKAKGCPADVSRPTLWRLKCGTEAPQMGTLLKLADHFGCRPSELLAEAERDLL